MKLSIIIPCYNKEPYIHELLDCLGKQITDEVQVIVIDDGSRKPLKVKHKFVELYRFDNQGVSKTRNIGLDLAKGEYISFIDADDLVAPTFIKEVMEKIKEGFDYLDMSWKSLPGGVQYSQKLSTDDDKLTNPSVCTRVFKKSFIGDLRFNEQKKAAEDEDFIRRLDLKRGKIATIKDYMYFYRTSVPNSLSKQYFNGSLEMKRIVYYFDTVTENMTYLIDEFKNEYEESEIILMTCENRIKELENYCHVQYPGAVRGTELRGEKTPLFQLILTPVKAQVVIYKDKINKFGGIETFIYNFCLNMRDSYDILLLYKEIDPEQSARFSRIVRMIRQDGRSIVCKTLIVNSILESTPENVTYAQKVQMCHTCKRYDAWGVPDADKKIFVSKVAKESFKDDGKVIHNLTVKKDAKKALILVSATRLSTNEKGEDRMLKLAQLFKDKGIPFIWLIFTDKPINNPVEGMICMSSRVDVTPFMMCADYVVQLSDSEAFCYTIVEALSLGIPALVSDLPVLSEIGFEDGENGYIIPSDMTCIDVEQIAECPLKFQYTYDNKALIRAWRNVLGSKEPFEKYEYKEVGVRVVQPYSDMQLQKFLKAGMRLNMEVQRAKDLIKQGLVEYDA